MQNNDGYHKSLGRKISLMVCSLILVFTLMQSQTYALTGAIGSHDPSALIKNGSRYWMFTTGNGIYAAYSDDLIRWTSGPKTIFPIGTWPSWINSAVPGFAGTFWAPDCVYMNGKYYMYYSCSTFGSSRSAIGVATSPTLDQNSSSYVWTDLGMVVSSTSSSQINAIDPAIFKDTNGKVYMTYGSFSNGIGAVELDPVTGKIKSGSSVVKVAGGSGADWEAPYMIKEGSYYYLFVNRGYCCRGTSSTYRIVVGRSTSPTGSFTDKSGVNLNSGGGTQVLGTSGRYIGPGHFGLLRENGSNFVSIHYYDGNDSGNAKLDILNMGFSSGWPFLTRDWIGSGEYRITNQNSGKVWDAWGCTGAAGQAIAQGTWANVDCQKWTLTPLGDGVYRFTCKTGGRSADIVNCNAANGAKVQLWDWLNNNCQKFKVERTSAGNHILISMTGTRIVEVPGASTTAGVQLALYDYNGNNCQKWTFTSTSSSLKADDIATMDNPLENTFFRVFPNPSTDAKFFIETDGDEATQLEIRDMQGKLVFQEIYDKASKNEISIPNQQAGFYIIRVKRGDKEFTKKLVVQ
jgi:arabinan endo-1,5-alpha-L-arabinosidase